MLALAEEADKAASSVGTQTLLQNALMFRAHNDLVKKEAAYADAALKYRRSLGPHYLMALLLSMDNPAKNACKENADIRKAQDMLNKESAASPELATEWTWAMVQESNPDAARKMAESVKQNEVLSLQRDLARILSPLSGGEACRAYWMQLMRGNADEAQAALKEFADRGVPLPVK